MDRKQKEELRFLLKARKRANKFLAERRELEQEKLNHKLAEIYEQKAVLDKIDPLANHAKAALGSLVEANGMLLFVSSALPKITIDGRAIIAVSPQSPLGQKLIGKEIGFSFDILTTNYTISRIF